jgi:creatinine amidohydrolase
MARYDMTLMTSPELADFGQRPDAVGLVPLGAVEQHGPHLPIATDAIIAEHLAAEVAASLPVPVLVAPVLPIGISAHHLGFAGTVHLDEDPFGRCVYAYVATMRALGLRRIALISAHGGNFGFIEKVVGEHRDAPVTVVGYADFEAYMDTMRRAAASCGVDVPASDTHAGGLETSQILYLCGGRGLRPDVVPDGFVANGKDWRKPLADKIVKEFSPSGVMGAPRRATAAAGRAICAALVDELAAFIANGLATEPSSPHRPRGSCQ